MDDIPEARVNDKIIYSILTHLKKLEVDSNEATKTSLNNVSRSITSLFDVNRESSQDFLDLDYNNELTDIHKGKLRSLC